MIFVQTIAAAVRVPLLVLIASALLLPHSSGADGVRRTAPSARSLDAPNVLRLTERDRLPQTRAVRIGRNKSVLVELPRELRDVIASSPEIVDVMVQTAGRVYLIGKGLGQSNAFFFDTNGEQILNLEIVVENDTAPLAAMLNRLLPGSDIQVEILNDTVVLTGSVRSPTDSNRANDLASRFMAPADSDSRAGNKVINMLTVEAEEQVMLKVVVAEVQREALKQFGVNLGAVINSGNFVTSILSSNALPLTAAAGLGTLPIPGINLDASATVCGAGSLCNFNRGPTADSFGNSGIAGGGAIGNATITNAIRALERQNLIRTLAEPNLTAISGEAANFRAGGEFPILVPSKDGTTIQFKEYGVHVAFTPTVLSEGRISLKIETEVSELTSVGAVIVDGFSVPALKTRRAKSTVELPSGGSLAMAGLISDDVRQNIDGLPGLKDVPVLGTLFRSRDFIKRETELVVIVTPYTVRPVARKDLALPTDGLAPATDFKANFFGHLNRIYGRDIAIPAGSLKDYGFIVE